jgi:hypothetical protein
MTSFKMIALIMDCFHLIPCVALTGGALPSVNSGIQILYGVAGPGLLLEETIAYYHASRFTDFKGGKIPFYQEEGEI